MPRRRHPPPSPPPPLPPPMDDIPALVPASPRAAAKVPITVLTGFLGAGKTTLIRNLLRTHQHLAIVMNELASTSALERALLVQTSSDPLAWIDIDGGCLCCAAKDRFMQAIESLLAQKRTVERIIVECSGLADPSAVIRSLWADDALECAAELDGVVCVVDGANSARLDAASPSHVHEAVQQVALADLVIVNKASEAGGSVRLAALRTLIHSINPLVRTVTTDFSHVASDTLFGLDAYRGRVPAALRTVPRVLPVHSSVRAVALHKSTVPGRAEFEEWLRALLWEGRASGHSLQSDIMRAKGQVCVADGVLGLQAVQGVYELTELSERVLEETVVVLIGRFVERDVELMTRSFACL